MNEGLNSIGYKLKQARINKGISLEEVYQKTKIHINILNTIEADKLQDFSPAYIKGFLKIYAQYLGLNAKEIIQQYQSTFEPKAETALREEKPKLQLNLPLFKSKIQLGFKLFIIVSIIFIFHRLILKLQNKKKITAKPTVERVKKDTISHTISPTKKNSSIKLAIRAKEDSWIQLICDGKKIFEGILKKGMQESWNAKNEIKLSVGNAGGLEIEANDKILAPLGRRGQVLKDIIITAEGISTAGKLH